MKPFNDRILVRREEAKSETASGLILPTQHLEKPAEGIVLAVGPNVKEAKKGDKVLFARFCGVSVEVKGESLLILREDECLGKL